MRLHFLLDDIAEDLGLDSKALGRKVGADERTIDKFRSGDANWRIHRNQLERIWQFAVEHGFSEGPFELRPHPLWSSFRDSKATIFRSPLNVDSVVEGRLHRYLESLNCQCDVKLKISEPEIIQNAMRSSNCVFVGSPRSSRSSEIALSSLFDYSPSSEGGASPAPIRFVSSEVPRTGKESPYTPVQPGKHQIEIDPVGRDESVVVPVDWLPHVEYLSTKNAGCDAGIAVVCPQPLGTEKRVTSVVIGGYTGLATEVLADELTHGEPAIYEKELQEVGVPRLAVLRFRYRKRKAPNQRYTGSLRTPRKETFRWGPPWPNIKGEI